MSCCGNQRASYRREFSHANSSYPSPQHASGAAAEFQYAGSGQLTVTGPLTGTVYRFAPGERVKVHPSDVPSMATVPQLRPAR